MNYSIFKFAEQVEVSKIKKLYDVSMKEQKLVAGVGINDYKNCEHIILSTWNRMLVRCYNRKCREKYPTYINCSVDSSWHKLSGFRTWFLQSNYKPGLALDKDIINRGNKIYSPYNCSFVSQRINQLIVDRRGARGKYLIGVSRKGVGYQSTCNFGKTTKYIGYFDTETEAFLAYKTFKEAHIKVVAEEEYLNGNCTKEVRDALLAWII